MKLQLKFETIPVFHWNDQSVLDEWSFTTM